MHDHLNPAVPPGAAQTPPRTGFDRRWISALVLLAGSSTIFIPSYYDLFEATWGSDSQGHMMMILGLSLWLIYRERQAILALPEQPAYFGGFVLLIFGVFCFALGRSQSLLTVELAAQLPIYASMLLLFRGWAGLRMVWFPILFLMFTVPLPGVITQALTVPLKVAVSTVAEALLYHTGYPVARTGVILTVGQYQLMVADACSGLSSIFTLEALGLLYMKLMDYKSASRNIFLAVMVLPISFVANVIRVIVLVLITYYFGDEVGQGIMHDAAGMLLFMVGLTMLLALDGVLNRFIKKAPSHELKPA